MLRWYFCAAVGAGHAVGGYDPTISRNFASLASMTYCGNMDKVLNWTCDACKESDTRLVPGKIRVVDHGGHNATRVVIGKLRDQNGCLMAFRGSDDPMNWVRNFEFVKTHPTAFPHCDGCRVHSGFLTIWRHIQDSCTQALNEVGCSIHAGEDNLLYITGHSLGAALTHLAIFDLHELGWTIAKTYSYESPRVGNRKFSDAFSTTFTTKFPVYRVSHHKDPVVHLPPENLGYHHIPNEVYYDKDGKYVLCPDSENNTCADQFWDIPSMVLLNSGDHCSSSLVPNLDICSPTNCTA